MNGKLLSTLTIATLSLAYAIPATAATIVDTGIPPSISLGLILDGRQSLAANFISPTTTLRNISIYLVGFDSRIGVNTTFHVVLYSNINNLPGTELFSARAVYNGGEGFYGVSNVNWAVSAGEYFAAFETRQGDTFSGFAPRPSPNPLGIEAFRTINGYLRLDEADLGIRIDDNLAASVPEPSTWAMIIVGFGFIGSGLRRRRYIMKTA